MIKLIIFFVYFLFQSKIAIAQFTQYYTPYSCDKCEIGDIKFGDMDNDGHLDMVVLHFHLVLATDKNRIVWFKNDGYGRFLSRQTISFENGQGSGLLLIDIDKDSDLDIIASYQSSPRVVYHENLGNGVFGPEKLILSDILAPKLIQSIGDYDNNGYDDFMCAASNINDKGIRLFLVDNGNVTVKVINQNHTTANGRFKSIDFDKDGDIDVIGQPTNSSLNWYKNENGLFNSTVGLVSFSVNTFSFAFDIGDINNDGDLDIISSNTDNQYMVYYENDGPGKFPVFPVKENIQRIGNQRQIKVIDVDKDNDLDIVTLAVNGGIIQIFENYNGNGFSSGRPILQDGAIGTKMYEVDFDLDGDVDIFVMKAGISNVEAGSVKYLENTTITSHISGYFYFDENENGIKDENENIIKDMLPRLIPEAYQVNYNDENGFKLSVRKGKYTASFTNNPCWELTSNQPSIYVVNLDTINVASIYFGVKRKAQTIDVLTKLTSSPTRCGFNVPFSIQVKNTGCSPVSGIVKIALDSLAAPLIPVDSNIQITGDTLYYTFDDIFSERINTSSLLFKIAGVEHIGDTVSMKIFTWLKDTTGNEYIYNESVFSSIINCAYDPNDKIVEPSRDHKNFTLQDEILFYTVRFQNTGTDTAFTVLIRDTLDSGIDITTLKVYNSSHSCTSDFNLLNNSLIFKFDNILLPDSTTNQEGSNGFVSYYCKSKNVAHKTKIQNKASIFFDFNPPIYTNTISNIIVKQFSCQDSISPQGKYTLPLQSDITAENISCHGQEDGTIFLDINFGTSPYILNETDTFKNEFILNNLKDSIYLLNIKDSGNCALSVTASINQPDTINVKSLINNSTDHFSNGSIKIESISGGNPPYQILWNNGSSDYELIDLSQGEYNLTITDNKGCTKTLTYYVESITGTEDNISDTQYYLQLFGNPVKDNLVFILKPEEIHPGSIEIYNNFGDCIYKTSQLNKNGSLYTVNVTNIMNGVYILRAVFRNQAVNAKFEIVR